MSDSYQKKKQAIKKLNKIKASHSLLENHLF